MQVNGKLRDRVAAPADAGRDERRRSRARRAEGAGAPGRRAGREDDRRAGQAGELRRPLGRAPTLGRRGSPSSGRARRTGRARRGRGGRARRWARLARCVVCGGLGGVMEAACRGAKRPAGRRWASSRAATGRRERAWTWPSPPASARCATRWWCARPTRSIAVGGEYGTLSEIALRAQDRQAGGRHRELGIRAWRSPRTRRTRSGKPSHG